MNIIEIIKKKRDKQILTDEEIEFIVFSYTKGRVPDYQFSAFLMAAFINGLDEKETSSLTKAMLYSGEVLDLSMLNGYKVDKHSTGGVGDKTSLIIAPIVAAAGIYVPMISGRGLGHTGGTLDKLESITGFNTNLNLTQYKKVLQKCGAVLIGQTKNIAPADKLIYALRDVTGTVESINLITASIMSKKLAEGIDGLVLDVKTGSGAFMKNMKDAKALANSLIKTAKSFNKEVITFITDMNQPLGKYIGNWFEVYESINVLKGEKVDGLYELSVNLAGAMIYLGKKSKSLEDGIELAEDIIANGKAFEKFIEITELQGGDIKYLLNPETYPGSKYQMEIIAENDGYIYTIDNYEIGMASLELGAGRLTKEDIIDPKAGIIFNVKIGEKLSKGDLIATTYSDSKAKLLKAQERILNSIILKETKTKKENIIKEIIK
jgi:pyrimidine-nucleoside phosphorylase